MRHGGSIVAETLLQHDVKFIFTLCGGHISPILVACREKGIRVVDVRHEATAVFAADAVSRLSPAIGVAAVTAGPGLTNTLTAVKNIQMAQVPVLLLGGATATILKGRGSLQDIDQMGLLSPLTKHQVCIKRVKDIANEINKAIIIAQSDVPGPVFVELPLDLLYPQDLVRELYGLNTDDQKRPWWMEKYLQRNLNRIFNGFETTSNPVSEITCPMPVPSAVRKASKMIYNSKRPVLLIGSQTMLNVTQVDNLAQKLASIDIPMFVSGMARGLLSKKELNIFRHQRKKALQEADLVILAGVPCDFRLAYGRQINRDAKIISINRSRRDLYLNRKPTLAIQADPGSFFSSFPENPLENRVDSDTWIDTLRQRDKERLDQIHEQTEISTDYVNPLKFFTELDKHLNDGDILIADGGDFVATASYILRPRSNLGWLDPGPFGTLGVGAGFILGGKLTHPNATIWGIYGDGAFGYSMVEFDTFVRHKIPLIAIIGNDSGWTQIARDQVEIFKDPIATELGNTKYHEVVAALGGEGLQIMDKKEIDDVLNTAKEFAAAGKSVAINVKIGKTDFRKGSISI
jgi:acetolactate synthase-1/2/3 large subunit